MSKWIYCHNEPRPGDVVHTVSFVTDAGNIGASVLNEALYQEFENIYKRQFWVCPELFGEFLKEKYPHGNITDVRVESKVYEAN